MSKAHLLLDKADENIRAADLLLQEGLSEISASRAYYAMFYIAEVLLFSKGLSFSRHSAVIAAYGKEFAKTGLLKPEYHKHLQDAFDIFQRVDYEVGRSVSREKAAEVLSWAKEFLEAARQYLKQDAQA